MPEHTLLIAYYTSLTSLLPQTFKSLNQMTGSTPVPEVTQSPLHHSWVETSLTFLHQAMADDHLPPSLVHEG